MVSLVLIAHTLQNLHGELLGGLVHQNRLEAALQGGVLLDVLAVLVQGGCTDGLQLASSQHGLEDGGGVNRAFGGTGTHQGMDLVDEQDDVAAGANLLQDLLQAFLEVTAVAGTGHEGAEIQGVQVLILEGLGDVTVHDGLGQALNHGGLTHTRCGGEVAAELIQNRGTRGSAFARVTCTHAGSFLLSGVVAGVAGNQVHDSLAHGGGLSAQLNEHLVCHALVRTNHAQQDVFGADVAVVQLNSLAHGQFENLLRAGGEGDVSVGGLGAGADDVLNLFTYCVQGNAQ